MDSPPLQKRLSALPDPEAARRDFTGQPMKRFGRPEEIANAVLFLASEESSLVTGIDLIVDGNVPVERPATFSVNLTEMSSLPVATSLQEISLCTPKWSPRIFVQFPSAPVHTLLSC